MKGVMAAAGMILILTFSTALSKETEKNSVISIEEAKEKIGEYIKGTKETSSFDVCEGNKYYIGQIYLKGYEGINVIRKIYVDKITGDIYPTMAETFDYCYMVKK